MSCSNNVKYSHKYPQLAFTLGNKWQQKNYVLMRHWEIRCASASRNCNRICNFFFFFGPPLFFFLLFFCFLKDSNTNALIPVHSPIPNHFFPKAQSEWWALGFSQEKMGSFSVLQPICLQKMRLNPVAVVIADGLKMTVSPPDSSGEHWLNVSMLKLSFWYPSLSLQFWVVNEDPKCI